MLPTHGIVNNYFKKPSTFIQYIPLKKIPSLVQSSGLADKGKFIYPSIITSDDHAKDTFRQVSQITENLKNSQWQPHKPTDIKKSFNPSVSKINAGRAGKANPKEKNIEAICSAVTTVCPLKPSFYAHINEKCFNTTVIPDLNTRDLISFIQIFDRMVQTETDELMKGKRKRKGKSWTFGRPKLFLGNYPFAPSQYFFGAVGILAAMGRWAVSAEETYRDEVYSVLSKICGSTSSPGCALYVINSNKISVQKFGHHVAQLAKEGQLTSIINGLLKTKIRSELDSYSKRFNNQTHELFWLKSNRFLQIFNTSSFKEFLSTKANYSSEIEPLLKTYFMNKKNIKTEIIESAKTYGQWLNSQAYFAAKASYSKDKINKEEAKILIEKEKAKILNELESAAMSATSPHDMLFRISTRAGRLLNSDLPPECVKFMIATASKDIEFEEAKHLLIAFSRLRKAKNTEEINDFPKA